MEVQIKYNFVGVLVLKKIRFTKMEGIGNDYVYIDATKESIDLTPEQIQKISNRNYGVGGDGVIFIRSSKSGDFKMDMYNSDGSYSEMCGNGVRCVGMFVHDKGLTTKLNPIIETGKGLLELQLERISPKTFSVTVDMGAPILTPSQIPIKWKNENSVINQTLEVNGQSLKFTSLSMGNPHAVIFVENADEFDVIGIGSAIEKNSIFPKRVNVEFVSMKGTDHLYQRTWERGAGETLACGTGACAVAVAANLTGRTGKKVQIDLRGGTLYIEWTQKGNILMSGPATTVFEGEIEI